MKNNFIKSTIILVIGGFFTKILGMIIKIALTRSIGTTGIGLYSLILPTFNLFITLSTMSLTISISKLVSEKKKKSKDIILPIIPLTLLYNFLLILFILLLSPLLSKYLLKNPSTYLPIMCIGLTLPFICISNLIRGYFFGKEKMFPHVFSNIFEQVVRLLLTIFLIPRFLKFGLSITISFVVLINIISEFSSILILLLFLPKHSISFNDFKFNKNITKEVLDISIPSTTTRLIGSLSYFLEPIILTFVLTSVGYSTDYIALEYGIINGYVYPILLLPSFFTLAISNALLPVISNSYVNKNYEYSKYKIKQAIFLSLLIGIPSTVLFILFPKIFLSFIYHTDQGIVYIKTIAPIFLLYYIQAPLTSALQAMNKAKVAMSGTLIGSVIRIIFLFLLSYFKIGMWGLIISSLSNIIFITIHHLYYVKKYLKREI